MNSKAEHPPELTDLLKKIAKLPKSESQAVFQLLIHLGERLHIPLNSILDTITFMQQNELSLAKQKESIKSIQVAGNQLLKLISDTVILAQAEQMKQHESITELQQIESKRYIKDLAGVRVLVVGEQIEQCDSLLKQFTQNGLQGKTATYDTALPALLSAAEQERVALQIVIVVAKSYDHHTAYLGRTIKANSLLRGVMMGLALPDDLPDFEKDRIHFDGFTCILNLSKPELLTANLANSWRGWAAKIHFAQTEIPAVKSRILLVEDDPISQKAIQSQLTSLNYEVDIAVDGQAALEMLAQKAYDLVFMDIGLPDISGLEVTTEIRKQEHNHHTPIIGLTMYETEQLGNSGTVAGMDELLFKPFLPEHLQAVLQRWLQHRT